MQGEEGRWGECIPVSLYPFAPQVHKVGCRREREGEGGGCTSWSVYVCPHQLVYMCFPPQVHKCPSQATHVHNLATRPLLIMINALSMPAEDFAIGCVLTRKEPVLIY